ncbi:hypothetical protein [Streptomyces sp. NPDC051364]|uniref:hypothetical protein n=1 Tax=Streptomyces sp. NPDC051364 TaxID=3155799 RepID=UPI00343A3A4E
MENAAVLRRDLTAALKASGAGLDVDPSAVTFRGTSGWNLLPDLNKTSSWTGKHFVLTALIRPVADCSRSPAHVHRPRSAHHVGAGCPRPLEGGPRVAPCQAHAHDRTRPG